MTSIPVDDLGQLAPPGVIRDQRYMIGRAVHQTPEDVQAAWVALAPEFLTYRRRRGDFSTDLWEGEETLQSYVSDGCWTANCPRCNGGVPTWPGGHNLGCCLDCGTVYEIDYPERHEEAVDLLAMRPPVNRHWFPHHGETVEDLAAQNAVALAHVERDEAAEIAAAHGLDVEAVRALLATRGNN